MFVLDLRGQSRWFEISAYLLVCLSLRVVSEEIEANKQTDMSFLELGGDSCVVTVLNLSCKYLVFTSF